MKRLLAALLTLMMLLTMTSCAAPDAAETDDKLTLVAFNVGKADALLLTSGDTAYLIDTGTEDSWADLSRALEALGVTHLTGVIVTHMDKDHYGGAKQLAESDIAIDGWYASWAWEKEKWKKHPVVKAAAVRGEEITLLKPGDTLSDGLLTVIGPIQEREESENDNSLVLVASGGGGKMLLTGDMEYDEENDLLAAGVIPSCEVLKVGHHGRDDATSAALELAAGSGLKIDFDEQVPHIINRAHDGWCPLERLCYDAATAGECLERINGFMARMRESAMKS